MSDSWEAFVDALTQESSTLERVNASAIRLTEALVARKVDAISGAERELESARAAFQAASAKRRSMQVRGFGQLTLRQVCAYAPRRLQPQLNTRLAELATGSISLGITTNNNKALIASGMERLMKVTAAMQKAVAEKPGLYRRRGFVPAPNNSVLLSSQV